MNKQWITVRTASGKIGRVQVDSSRPISEQIGADWLWYACHDETANKPAPQPADQPRKTGCGWAILVALLLGLTAALVAVFVYVW